jgi:hypothetical protein
MLGLIKPNNYARPYAMPAGVLQDRVRAIETAFSENLARSRPDCRSRAIQAHCQSDLRGAIAQHDFGNLINAQRPEGETPADAWHPPAKTDDRRSNRLPVVKFFVTRRGRFSETQLASNSFRGANRPSPGLTSGSPDTAYDVACRGFEEVGEGGVRIMPKISGPTAAIFHF